MFGELVSFPTKDKLLLQGFFAKAGSKKAVIFVHGLRGGMNNKTLASSVYNTSKKLGFNFLMFNNRGHDVISKISYVKKWRKIIGGSLENFTDCKYDIQAAVDFVKKKGCNKIILIGHSTGCQKSAYYLSQKPDKKIGGVIFLAPGNDTECEILYYGLKKHKKRVELAKRLVKNKIKNKFIDWFSPKRFLSLHCGVESSIFDYTKKKLNYISKIKVPILALFGSKDCYVTKGMHKKELQLIKDSANIDCEIVIIKGGDHHFKENINGMSKVVQNWLKRFK